MIAQQTLSFVDFLLHHRWILWKGEKTEVQTEESYCSVSQDVYWLLPSLLDLSSQRLIEKWLGRGKRDREIEKEESLCHLYGI
jgi:hypothetical protein